MGIMTEKTSSGDIFTEGKVKKGGVRAKPSSPKPVVKPAGQKPSTKKSE